MRIAIEGCCHGELDNIYRAIAKRGQKVDLLLICGDFQSIRNEADLATISCPRKFLSLGTFHKYYSGEARVPMLTIFIGGNHECSNYLWELYHGGWAAPGIYFLGMGSVINVGGLRIGGMSGIYKVHDYQRGHFETSPYDNNTIRSAYHVRRYDVFKMLQVKEPLDIFLSHDWPLGIEQHGDIPRLVAAKRFFEQEIRTNTLGSKAFEEVLVALKPDFWFSAHLHVRFQALVEWHTSQQAAEPPSSILAPSSASSVNGMVSGRGDSGVKESNPDEISIADSDSDEPPATHAQLSTNPINANPDVISTNTNPDEIAISLDEDDEDAKPNAPSEVGQESKNTAVSNAAPVLPSEPRQGQRQMQSQMQTRRARTRERTYFLALDKCMPKKQFLEIIDLPHIGDSVDMTYDEEWLSIVRTLDASLSLSVRQDPPPQGERLQEMLQANRAWVKEHITDQGRLAIPFNFVQTAPPHNYVETLNSQQKASFIQPFCNPQTEAFCSLLQIPNRINPSGRRAGSLQPPPRPSQPPRMSHPPPHGPFAPAAGVPATMNPYTGQNAPPVDSSAPFSRPSPSSVSSLPVRPRAPMRLSAPVNNTLPTPDQK